MTGPPPLRCYNNIWTLLAGQPHRTLPRGSRDRTSLPWRDSLPRAERSVRRGYRVAGRGPWPLVPLVPLFPCRPVLPTPYTLLMVDLPWWRFS